MLRSLGGADKTLHTSTRINMHIHTYIHTCIHTYTHTALGWLKNTPAWASRDHYIQTYTHTHIHTYTHTHLRYTQIHKHMYKDTLREPPPGGRGAPCGRVLPRSPTAAGCSMWAACQLRPARAKTHTSNTYIRTSYIHKHGFPSLLRATGVRKQGASTGCVNRVRQQGASTGCVNRVSQQGASTGSS